MYVLYYLEGRRHSEQARKIVEENIPSAQIRSVSDKTVLTKLFIDNGIERLPTLQGEGRSIEGVSQIREYVDSIVSLK